MKVRGYQLLFKAIVGSHSYGTNIEGSDVDHKGVFIQEPEDVLLNGYVPQIEVSKDEVYFEVGRFLNLCESANPTVLELLYTPEDCVVYTHPVYKTILEERQMFLSKKCRNSFGGYAVQQIQKARGLNKKMNWEKERKVRKDVLDFCYVHEGCGSTPIDEFLHKNGLCQEDVGLVSLPHMRNCYAMYFSSMDSTNEFIPAGVVSHPDISNDVCLTSIPKRMENDNIPYLLYFNKDAYTGHCKDYKEYRTWLEERNTQRYVDIEGHGQKIDGKNMLHCVRLIETALEIVEQKQINVRRPNTDYLVSIRKGKVGLKSLLDTAEAKLQEMEKSFIYSNLPNEADSTKVKELVVKVRKTFYDLRDRKTNY